MYDISVVDVFYSLPLLHTTLYLQTTISSLLLQQHNMRKKPSTLFTSPLFLSYFLSLLVCASADMCLPLTTTLQVAATYIFKSHAR